MVKETQTTINGISQRTIMLIEDDLKLADLVKEFLESNGFKVAIEPRGDKAPQRILAEQPDLVILDLMLPGLDGLSVCRKVRPSFKKPILMLTARSEEVDEVVGLEVGADDYLAKPVRPRLLLARINTLLRRTLEKHLDEKEKAVSDEDEVKYELGSLVIDVPSRVVKLSGKEIELTTAEFELLLYLAKNSGRTVAREDIYQDLRGMEWDGLDRSIDLRVVRLRRKLGDDGKNPKWIKSVRGAGYMLAVNK